MKSTFPALQVPSFRGSLRSQAAFTLVEIMIVVAIIGLLAGLAVTQLGDNLGYANDTKAKADITTLEMQLKLYETMNGFPPSTEQGLKALVTPPSSNPTPRAWRQLMKSIPIDPWGQEYRYAQPGTHNRDSYDIFSSGKDRIPGNADDIGNWKTGAN